MITASPADATPLARGVLALRRLARWTLRRLGLGANPLRRPSDRWEAYARLAALALCFASVLPAARVGGTVQRDLSHQAANRTPRTATVLSDPMDAAAAANSTGRTATVGWLTAGGTRRTASAAIPADARRGSRFTLWTAADGTPTTAPLGPIDRWADAVMAAVAAELAAIAVLWLGLLLLKRLLDRRRYRAWAHEWSEACATRRSQY